MEEHGSAHGHGDSASYDSSDDERPLPPLPGQEGTAAAGGGGDLSPDGTKKKKEYQLVAGHRFRPFYFPKPTWCSQCKEFIWGVNKKQGYKCKDCDFGLHYRCLPDVKRQCSQDDVKPLKSPSTSRSTFFNTVRGKNTLNINTEPIADSETASVSTDNGSVTVPEVRITTDEASPTTPSSQKAPNDMLGGSSSKKKSGGLYATLSRASKNITNRLSGSQVKAHHGHEFVVYTFLHPAWCSHCNNFIWGLEHQGYLCKKCHANSHHKCVDRVVMPCRRTDNDDAKSETSVRSRRSASSRLVTEVQPVLVEPTTGFEIEDGLNGRMFDLPDDEQDVLPASPRGDAPAAVTNADDEDWYQLYFMNFDHENFITVDKESNENYVLSVIKQHVQNDDGTKSSQYRVIVWLKTGKEQHIVPVHGDDVLTATQLLGAVVPTLASKKPQLLHLPADTKEYQDLKEQLLQMEKEQNTHTFKFGVLYCKPGQSKDTEYFCNEHGSPLLYEFMDTIASKIKLAGWSKFRGGLDAKENLTGPESYYSEFCGNEVMFHVSTMLPYVATDPQQLSRKRHIGNDIVTIIFVDEPDFKFNPTSVVSHFLHAFMIVQPLGMKDGFRQYRINVVSNDFVPVYGPDLPYPPVMHNPKQLRSLVLSKLINAEKAAYLAPEFQKRRERTMKALLEHIQQRYSVTAKRTKGSSRLDISPQMVTRTPSLSVGTPGDEEEYLFFSKDGTLRRHARQASSSSYNDPASPTS